MITSTRKLIGKDDITNLDIQPTEDVNSLKHGEVVVGNWGSDTKREFKSRHLSMLAVGGTIGYVFRFIRFFHVIWIPAGIVILLQSAFKIPSHYGHCFMFRVVISPSISMQVSTF